MTLTLEDNPPKHQDLPCPPSATPSCASTGTLVPLGEQLSCHSLPPGHA